MCASLASSVEINLELQPKQKLLWELWDASPHIRIGYGGSRGGGKSAAARLCLILRRLKYPRTNGLILRRTLDELRKNHIEPIFLQFPFMREWWVEKDKSLRFPNGSILYFGYAEHEPDMQPFFGSEFADIVPEEAGLFRESELQKLEGSCRWSSGSITPKMVFPFMPGGPGHNYLKRIFIDRDFRGEENPDAYTFIQAYGWDNIEWARRALVEDGVSEKDFYSWDDARRRDYFLRRTEYGRSLAGLADEQLRKAWLDGSWTVHEGTVFPELDAALHDLDRYIDPHNQQAQREFAKHLKLMAGMDHATTGVTACVEHGVDWDENLFALEEYYERNRTIAEHAFAIIPTLSKWGAWALSGQGRMHGQQYIVIDPSTEAKTLQKSTMTGQHELTSVLDEYARHEIRATPAHRSMISVGIDVLHGLLRVDPNHRNPFTQQLGSPRLFISKTLCPNLWREIRDLQKQRNSDGNWEFLGSDHALDTCRYVAMTRPTPAAKAEKDISHLPAQDQLAHRVHDSWAKNFGKSDGGNQHFSGMFPRR